LDSLIEEDLVFLPELKDPIEQFVEELAGADLLMESVLSAGISQKQLNHWLTVRKMLSSKDRIQARLPYFIEIQ